MNTEQIVTAGDFRSFLIALSKGVAAEYKGSLEEYLRALWGVVHHYCRSAVSYSLLGKVILDALTAEPLPFDESWLAYKAPPEALLRDPSLVEDDFESLREMILYQIADLHLMEQAGTLNNPHRYFGIGSPTGHT